MAMGMEREMGADGRLGRYTTHQRRHFSAPEQKRDETGHSTHTHSLSQEHMHSRISLLHSSAQPHLPGASISSPRRGGDADWLAKFRRPSAPGGPSTQSINQSINQSVDTSSSSSSISCLPRHYLNTSTMLTPPAESILHRAAADGTLDP